MGKVLISTVHAVCLLAIAGPEANSCVVDSMLLCSQLTMQSLTSEKYFMFKISLCLRHTLCERYGDHHHVMETV